MLKSILHGTLCCDLRVQREICPKRLPPDGMSRTAESVFVYTKVSPVLRLCGSVFACLRLPDVTAYRLSSIRVHGDLLTSTALDCWTLTAGGVGGRGKGRLQVRGVSLPVIDRPHAVKRTAGLLCLNTPSCVFKPVGLLIELLCHLMADL